jgi:monofunctional glycosyltransferase
MAKRRKSWSFFGVLWRLAFIAALGGAIYVLQPVDTASLKTQNPKTTSLIELRKQQAEAAGKKFRPRMSWRPLTEISPHLVHAILLAEDDRFYQHKGFDLEQIQIALERNWQAKQYVYGGSTLTQQLARTLFLSPRKNLLRKAREAVITYHLERDLPKRRILELYLNAVEWGNGIFGAEAAAQHYFGTGADALTPDQAVALASILPSPRRWSPLSERGFMARRRTRLIDRMQRAGYLPNEAVSVSSETLEVPSLDELQGLDDDASEAPLQPAFP